jgi:hypothetical protein
MPTKDILSEEQIADKIPICRSSVCSVLALPESGIKEIQSRNINEVKDL